MNSNTKEKRGRGSPAGKVLVFVGLICLLTAAALGIYNIWDSNRAGEASAKIEESLIEKIRENMNTGNPGSSTGGGSIESILQTIPMEILESAPYKDMPVEVIDGYRYIGFLEIPSIGLSLPVMEEWDYDRLKVSPCRYSGSYYTDDLVICAHNYYRHFTPVKDNLGMGEDVYFTNVLGESIHYQTVNKETVAPTDIRKMVQDSMTSEKLDTWDLTLFTCNVGGQTRVAIRCQRV